jgi:hypothetical protein
MNTILYMQAISTVGVFGGLISLSIYRTKKRFKDRPINSIWAFLDHNIVELIHAGVIAPNVINVLGKALS